MKNSQLSVGIHEAGEQYLEYKEEVSKTDSGGLAHAYLKRSLKDALFDFTRSIWHTYLKMPPSIPSI